MEFHLRPALLGDIPALTQLIDASVRGLQSGVYTAAQIDRALATVYGVDTQLILDGTYFVVEAVGAPVACGGWSKRKTLYGGDQCSGREDSLLNPLTDAAKIRAFFVHPDWIRKGIGTRILEKCEGAARQAGFSRFEMGSTLTGVALYRARGYVEVGPMAVPLPGGDALPIVRMEKRDRPNWQETSSTD